ncbi:hypothetical protein V5799_025704 [Amblyomma americanum]|uniref:Uncharacterized protein n=1 Tax=Amblyomma americanum TaxID=6943 RepID=A0AAQ4E8V3_AMBAM
MRGTFGMAPREAGDDVLDPSLLLDNASMPSDDSGFRVEFSRRPSRGEGGDQTPREPPFFSVTMRPRTNDTKEPVITWPPSPETYSLVPADNLTDAGPDTASSETQSSSNTPTGASSEKEASISAQTEASSSADSTSKPAAVIARQLEGLANNVTSDGEAGEDDESGEDSEDGEGYEAGEDEKVISAL